MNKYESEWQLWESTNASKELVDDPSESTGATASITGCKHLCIELKEPKKPPQPCMHSDEALNFLHLSVSLKILLGSSVEDVNII